MQILISFNIKYFSIKLQIKKIIITIRFVLDLYSTFLLELNMIKIFLLRYYYMLVQTLNKEVIK